MAQASVDPRVAESISFLEKTYVGPMGGLDEEIQGRPDLTYLVGVLYPLEPPNIGPRIPEEQEVAVDLGDGDTYDDEGVAKTANAWRPASAAMSFIHDGTFVTCDLAFGTYSQAVAPGNDAATKSWRRAHHAFDRIRLGEGESKDLVSDEFNVRVTSRWRRLGSEWLVTVAVTNRKLNISAPDQPPVGDSIYQISLTARAGDGHIKPYNSVQSLNLDDEEQELALRYRGSKAYAVGHGTSVTWDPVGGSELDTVTSVSLAPLPRFTVPSVEPSGSESEVMVLDYLAEIGSNCQGVVAGLRDFVTGYDLWIATQRNSAEGLPDGFTPAAKRIVERAAVAKDRMMQGIDLLESDETSRTAFALAMRAMRDQMAQSHLVTKKNSSSSYVPKWRPFQLGFILLTLASQLDAEHQDRDLVDLIWFPTGGGKTEAYLGLAAIEMFARRLRWGIDGGGTAVITRYTLRLLSVQQFQRAATLVCAMELMRATDQRVHGMQPFTIGLWVGNETTPGTFEDAYTRLESVKKMAVPENPFQLTACPWCGTRLMPSKRSDRSSDYGAVATRWSFKLRCPSEDCAFHEELPVQVVDESIYAAPPTFLLSTVDKFARFPFEPRAGRILGQGGLAFYPPTLIIQDELHLLSGPLGTTVAIYEAAIHGLLTLSGTKPKVVASTATIRAATHQVRQLFDAEVAVYPPSGLDQGDSYFARESFDKPGRTYIGLMPQAFSNASAAVKALTPLLELPAVLTEKGLGEIDDYWTLVAYHNSLRELGKTVTLARDDVSSALRMRAHDKSNHRNIRGDGLVELTSNIAAEELPNQLARLERPAGEPGAVDFVASTNMLSVGIDVSRLALMLMNGQPKTTSEYIQATSRVGRGSIPGLVVTLFRATRPRDRSHFEAFTAFHQSLYRSVEPTSVTPWSEASRRRSLPGVLTSFVRHAGSWVDNKDAIKFNQESFFVKEFINNLIARVERQDPEELEAFRQQLRYLLAEWSGRAQKALDTGSELSYSDKNTPSLLKAFGENREGWPVANSMRTVERNVRILIKGED
jgi:hypothetical protein